MRVSGATILGLSPAFKRNAGTRGNSICIFTLLILRIYNVRVYQVYIVSGILKSSISISGILVVFFIYFIYFLTLIKRG